MSKLIRTEKELQSLMDDVRNRQYEPNPMKIDISNIFHIDIFDWDKEYLDIIEFNGIEVVYLKQYIK